VITGQSFRFYVLVPPHPNPLPLGERGFPMKNERNGQGGYGFLFTSSVPFTHSKVTLATM